ncbi:MAG: VOC family protein [Rhodopseudomonas sp.]|uniref:VOC family protein n=1 Tax=Rhodopseudomonas sp. TaxID=1078 RepID=UPI0017D45F97|nr:VOC family protein [Rhodopseudomonas sp.]NVN85263.1 VOC family protein [Rhodopseudomonas sp.]
MALENIIGIDHAVIVVKDLDQAAANWKRLGFTVSPRGTHSALLGSGNYTIMFGDDYIELLGILVETEHNAPSRAFLAERGEGIERIAFTATDAAAGAKEVRELGWAAIGPIDFGRPVTLPNGGQSEAKFSIFQWPVTEAPAGLRIFACQHRTRDAVWIPELQNHANTVTRLKRVLIVSPNPVSDARHLWRLIDGELDGQPDGSVIVPSGSDRAEFVFMTRELLGQQYPGVSLDGLPERGGAGLVLGVSDPAAAAQAVGAVGVRVGNGVAVPPAAGNGVLLAFVAD